MTYFDQIADAVYDGSQRVSPSIVGQAVRAMGLQFPLYIVAATPPSQSRTLAGMHRHKYFWHLHEGVIYVLKSETAGNSKSIALRGWLCGEAQRCTDAARFISQLQDAIVSFRRVEMESLIRAKPAALSLAAEFETRRIALTRIRETVRSKSTLPEDWRGALEVWLEIILWRHEGHLNTLRWKLSEFMALLTCDFDEERNTANGAWRVQQELFRTHSLAELRRKYPVMIAELLREFPTFTAWPQQPLSPIAQRALEWMKEHCERPVSVTDCAAAIPVNAAYLSRVLQKETGIPPVLHLQQMRIAHAKVLLQESRCTVEEVAHRSGFKTTEHFHRVFKKCTNLSPASFRRSTQKT